MNQKLLQMISILFLLFFITSCISPKTLASVPANSPTSKPTVISTITKTLVPTSTPEPFNRVTEFDEKDKMSIITLEDLKSSSELTKWEQAQIDKIGQIANDPTRIDYFYAASTNCLCILDHHQQGNIGRGVQSTEFFSYYKINLAPWEFPDKMAYVITYAYEDITGEKTPARFFVSEKQINDSLNRGGLTKNLRGRRLTPISVIPFGETWLIVGKPGGPDDLRSMANIFYKNQGYTTNDIVALFKRIDKSDTISKQDKAMFESILFWATDGMVSDAELQ